MIKNHEEEKNSPENVSNKVAKGEVNSQKTGTDAAIVPEHISLSDEDFRLQLAEVIPHLRAFGRSLSGNRETAEDLVQETLLKAWAARVRFQAGTSMRAWTFIILRNLFLSQMRRARFRSEWNEEAAAKQLVVQAGQDQNIALGDIQRALGHLPTSQREALILIGAGGFSYEEAAEICDCAVGTIKSRVARGRAALEKLVEGETLSTRHNSKQDSQRSALDMIMDEVNELRFC
ncbi:MAG: sigma-70 family RNA polymerase sigma factor [Zymomonas mobilis subsp. pomaceae]|uniref:sigma-70 family RNA polymerase sigma factor n=1 Tax=Zymomonas mobilis TaxID=542 RepID=UPI0039E93031